MNALIDFFDRMVNKLADGLGTKLFFILCVALDLVELGPVIKAHDVITWCTYISQTVIQLLALPLLSYQNKFQLRKHDELHAKLKLQHKHIREIHKHLGLSNGR